jgi:large subunit ribosomal protein L10
MIDSLKAMLDGALGLLLLRPQGLKVQELEAVRNRLGESQARLRVVKNTLFRLALTGTPYEALSEHLKGSVAAVCVYGDIGAALSALQQARASAPALEVVAGYLGGRVRTPAEVASLGSLPGVEMLAAQVVGCLRAPLMGVVRALHSPMIQLVATLQVAAHKAA